MNRKLLNEELNRKSVEDFKKASKTPLILVLDNVRSLNNVGSAFRTADSFLLEAIYLCGHTGTPPHRDIHKTALGATETVAWKHFSNTLDAIEALKKQGYKVYAVEQAEQAVFLNDFSPPSENPIALIFGNEVNGVSQEVVNTCEQCIEIPQLGSKHSLNISVSIGIVIWDVVNKIKLFNTIYRN
jgi:23S rRNA (guanosine2251-2'-O)-methyltransferase